MQIDRKALVEAFPSSFLGMMIQEPARLAARRGNRSDIFFQYLAATGILRTLIEHCIPGRRMARDLSSVVNHDDRAALVCALRWSAPRMGGELIIDIDGDDSLARATIRRSVPAISATGLLRPEVE